MENAPLNIIELESREVCELLEVLAREKRKIAFHQDYGKVAMYEKLIKKIQQGVKK